MYTLSFKLSTCMKKTDFDCSIEHFILVKANPLIILWKAQEFFGLKDPKVSKKVIRFAG